MSSRHMLSLIWSAMVDELGSAKRSLDDLESEYAKDQSQWKTDRLCNESVTHPYKYAALAAPGMNGDNSVRLLELLPGSRQDDICCRLVEADLNECNKAYEALSYVWGASQDMTPIQVNDATLMVGTNLRSALFHLRSPKQSRILWVDAVCINQQDIDEKAQQVAIMGTIYRSAKEVIVWLGDATKYSKEAFKSLTMLDNARRTLLKGDGETEALRSKLQKLFKHDTIIAHMFELPWWFRAWTAQEIILATDALIVWGDCEISWDVLVGGVEFGIDFGIWESAGLGVWNNSELLPLQSVVNLKRETPLSNVADNILRHLAHTRFRHATQHSDKIFSVLGLSKDNSASLGIQPDYRAPSTDIYRHFAERSISVAGNYDILGFCQDADDCVYTSQLPSWVPDWSSTKYIAMPLLTDSLGKPRLTYASGRSSKAIPVFRNGGAVMVTRGHILDRIDAMAAVLSYLDEAEWEEETVGEGNKDQSIREMFQEVGAEFGFIFRQFQKVVPQLETYIGWETFVRDMHHGGMERPPKDATEVYMQTICAGTMAPGGREETRKLFQSWLDSLSSVRRLKSWKVDRWQSLYNPLGLGAYLKSSWNGSGEFAQCMKAAYERRLGATKSRQICLLPKRTEIGDCLVILEGARVPVILRSGINGTYTFIGEAYVHGIMDGSAFDETKCEELHIC